MNSDHLRVTTPEILWHGGGLLPGKPDPVLSVDIFQEDILATAGIDANVPPKGSVRVRQTFHLLFLICFLVVENGLK
jgi:hypothetical protein